MHLMSPSSQPPRSSLSLARSLARRRIWRTLSQMAGAMCLLGALALAGCGVTTTGSVLGGGVTNSNTPQPGSSDGSQATPTSVSKSGGSGGTTVRPCLGDSVAPTKTPTIVLTVKNSQKTTPVHVGDVIEVQLAATMRWSTLTDVATSPVLTPLQPQGGMDDSTQTCRWVYAVKAPGAVTLTFIGVFNCEPNTVCPAIAEDEEFTIQAS